MGVRLTGKFRQLNASPTFSLIRLETNGVALWFKATGKPNEHELAIALSLARLFPRYVPRVLGLTRLGTAGSRQRCPARSLMRLPISPRGTGGGEPGRAADLFDRKMLGVD